MKAQESEKENRKVYPGLLASKVEPLPVRSFLQVRPTLNNTEFSDTGRSFPSAFLKYLGHVTKNASKNITGGTKWVSLASHTLAALLLAPELLRPGNSQAATARDSPQSMFPISP